MGIHLFKCSFFFFKIAERICPIMHTNFGGMWETRADLQHQDTAYTNEKIPFHNDNTYWREPTGYINEAFIENIH